MDKTDGYLTNPLARCYRALPALTIGLTLLAGSTSLSAQQYIAERMYDEYQARLHTQQTKPRAAQPVARVRSGAASPVEALEAEKTLPKPKPRPILQPES